jgi:hypothetical protein
MRKNWGRILFLTMAILQSFAMLIILFSLRSAEILAKLPEARYRYLLYGLSVASLIWCVAGLKYFTRPHVKEAFLPGRSQG